MSAWQVTGDLEFAKGEEPSRPPGRAAAGCGEPPSAAAATVSLCEPAVWAPRGVAFFTSAFLWANIAFCRVSFALLPSFMQGEWNAVELQSGGR